MKTLNMTSILNSFSPKLDGSQRDHVKALIHDFRREQEQQMKNIQMEADKQKQRQKQLHATEMVRIPKTVKQMSVDDFNLLYQCDLLQMIRETEAVVTTNSVLPAGLQTPSFKSKMKLETPSRTVRRGEGI
jgi:TATA-binding protein-associated factor Taf7